MKHDFVETQQAIDALTAHGRCCGHRCGAALDHEAVNDAIAALAEKTK